MATVRGIIRAMVKAILSGLFLLGLNGQGYIWSRLFLGIYAGLSSRLWLGLRPMPSAKVRAISANVKPTIRAAAVSAQIRSV